MIKPIIIYSLARTRSTAVLQAARRTHLLHEPFDFHSVFKDHNKLTLSNIDFANRLLNTLDWHNLKSQMSDSDTATKFFGTGLHKFYPAQKWFKDVEYEKFKRVTDYMKENPVSEEKIQQGRRDFYSFFSENDRRLGTDLLKTFPEYTDFYNQCKVIYEQEK